MADVTRGEHQEPAGLSAADEQLLRELTERARAGGLQLAGEGGLLGQLAKLVIEGALEGEMDDHLGYAKNDPAGRNGGDFRNGHRAKTVLTDTGPVEVSVPRDRDASFEPKIVAKRQGQGRRVVARTVARICRSDLIVVDDIGMLPAGQDAAEAFYRITDAAYERRSVAVNSNIHG
jgi:hypothetical protein